MQSRSRLASFSGAAAGMLVLIAVAGCGPVEQGVEPVDLIEAERPPVRVGVTDFELVPPPLLLPKRTLFEQSLTFHLNRPVSFDLLTPRQLRVQLQTGRLDFAMISAADYCEVASEESSRILAVMQNLNGQIARRGLIIVAADSEIHSLSEIRGDRFHFLPRGDLLNDAARGVLLSAGVIEPEPRSTDEAEHGTFHLNSLQVVRSVLREAGSAGVIDEADYHGWKETGGNALLLDPSRDQIRVIGHTVWVPQGPVLVSNETPPELAERFLDYLLNAASRQPLVVRSLGISGFAEPLEPQEYAAFCEVYRRLYSDAAADEMPLVEGDETADQQTIP